MSTVARYLLPLQSLQNQGDCDYNKDVQGRGYASTQFEDGESPLNAFVFEINFIVNFTIDGDFDNEITVKDY